MRIRDIVFLKAAKEAKSILKNVESQLVALHGKHKAFVETKVKDLGLLPA